MAEITYTNGKTETDIPETKIGWDPPFEIDDEILKTLMSIADTLLTISRTLDEVRYSVAKLRK